MVDRRLAAILAADVVGYSRLMEANEERTMAAMKDHRREFFDPTMAKHGGRIFKVMGDGFLVEFGSVVNAVRCAAEIQHGMPSRNEGVPEDQRIFFRIGVNLGDVIIDGTDIYGEGVNVAARLEALAEPGSVVVSASVREHVGSKLGLGFDDLGMQTLKNIETPVRMYRVAMPDRAVPEQHALEASLRTASIAILPFANLSDDPAQSYFSDGFTEDIITELSRWRRLAVQSRSASFRYRGVAVDVRQVARELSVRYIVEGSIRRMGERVRITAQLIDTDTGNHVWAEKFDRKSEELFAVQDQVVQTIVGTIMGKVLVAEADRARRKPPASLAAYECVLKGNALPWDDPAGATEATRLFAQAIELDPGYGFAHTCLAEMLHRNWFDDPGNPDALLHEALVLSKRAVELDPSEGTSLAMLGLAYLYHRSFDQALQCVQRSVELNPNNQWVISDLGIVLTYLEKAEDGLEWLIQAREIDPYFGPQWYWRSRATALMTLQRYGEALSALGHVTNRGYLDTALLAGCHARLGDMANARLFAAECLAARPDFSVRWNMSKEPYKNPADAARIAESLRMAGLPD